MVPEGWGVQEEKLFLHVYIGKILLKWNIWPNSINLSLDSQVMMTCSHKIAENLLVCKQPNKKLKIMLSLQILTPTHVFQGGSVGHFFFFFELIICHEMTIHKFSESRIYIDVFNLF
jgi:hypothetical protein